ncbi:MAG: hypothetical protein IK143_04130 [Bacteroidales bacterium]|nr:hypothetical protein [Bacteroidales bacterium]
MRRILSTLICLTLTYTITSAQDLPDNEAYKARMDSLSNALSTILSEWNKSIPPHYRAAMRLEKEAESHPEHRDSLLTIAAKEREIGKSIEPILQAKVDQCLEEKRALVEKYALIFEDAFPYFHQRNNYSKDSLSVLLETASSEIRRSRIGKALRKFINARQIMEGERFQIFRCYDSDGKRFDWKQCKGKKVFLVHDGLWCMTHGTDNTAFRTYLYHLRDIAPHCMPLIVVNCDTREELLAEIEEYGLQDFTVVSEFKNDIGTLNWLYNDDVTPTCHHIDERGIIVKTTQGVDPDYLEKVFLK